MASLPPLRGSAAAAPYNTDLSTNWVANYKSSYQLAFKESHNSDAFIKEVMETRKIKSNIVKSQNNSSLRIERKPKKRQLKPLLHKPKFQEPADENEHTGLMIPSMSEPHRRQLPALH